MTMRFGIAAAAAVFFLIQPASAAPPKFQGDYGFSQSKFCQSRLDTNKNLDGAVTEVLETSNNFVEQQIAKARFNPVKGKVTIEGHLAFGDAVVVDGEGGNPMRNEAFDTPNAPYSNTLTTLTLNSFQYKVIYVNVKNGIVKYALIHRRVQNCAEQGSLLQP